MGIYENIKALCDKKNETISSLEKDLGYSCASLYKANENISARRLFEIADHFGVSMEYVFNGNGSSLRYRRLGEVTANAVSSFARFLFPTAEISHIEIDDREITFLAISTDDAGRNTTDRIKIDITGVSSETVEMDDEDQEMCGKWLLAMGVDPRLSNNPFMA